jgi:2-amino-4-hydroxy-6-hydroxymethyldihydropteridine diphosphokinase
MKAWIGLGGNQGQPAERMRQALALITAAEDCVVIRRSRVYRSAPWGREDQPEFLNAVAETETDLSPHDLLGLLLETERKLGRTRDGSRWGPRCIDLDLLTYEQCELAEKGLVLPHPQMHLRAFVLVPLLELEPDFAVPGKGPAVKWLAQLEPGESAGVLPSSESIEE